jgi:hypothetical protein
MTKEQYMYELFKLYHDRHFLVDVITTYGPEHDFCLPEFDIPNAGQELENTDKQILDLMHTFNEEDELLFQDCAMEIDRILEKILEELKAKL